MTDDRFLNKDDLLRPENMMLLYSNGAFPMADEQGEIDWYMPEVRTIIPIDNYNIPRSLRKFMEKSEFEYRYDYNRLKVIKQCANRNETWISKELIEAYKRLINLNFLHSVEVYENNKLVGGLYGVAYNGAFFGESMFSKVTQASKTALVKLLEHLSNKGFALLDVQYQTEHLEMFGAKEISFKEFEQLLVMAYKQSVKF